MDTEKHSHWHILGAGAIGTLVAFKLSLQQRAFTFMSKSRRGQSRDFTDFDSVKHHLVGVEREAIDCLIICTKSTQAIAAFEAVQSRLSPQSLIVCLFNGLGAQEAIQARANCPVFFATTTEGVSKTAVGGYAYKGAGETMVDDRILQFITHAGLPKLFTAVSNIDEHLLNKLVVNSLINPLTVLFDCKNGELLSNVLAMTSMRTLACEIALWLSTYAYTTSAEAVLNMAVAIAKSTANNTSSMRQDIQQKQQSEIDFINGYWLKHNPKKLILKENARVVAEIKKIELGFLGCRGAQ